MYGAIIELVVVAAVIVLVNGDTVKYYATKYDHLDIERILNNRRMVTYYAQCLLSKGPCPPQGVEFKSEYHYRVVFKLIHVRMNKYLRRLTYLNMPIGSYLLHCILFFSLSTNFVELVHITEN
ncbi:hypothetical protein WA026_022422 [Henosepilachna vigintioctopunctata]|uniref:Uncharacterized protein n=1 Tax=Henosepilachna vigintioctopunctata TaxID=420089 RepID=A0AAW1U699_9CUCU